MQLNNSSSPIRVLIIGSTGLAGQAFHRFCVRSSFEVFCLSRTGAQITYDCLDKELSLLPIVNSIKPHIIVNCIALVSLQQCEDNPDLAFKLNALLVDELVDAASSVNASLLHISTDHFYLGNANLLHKEDDP